MPIAVLIGCGFTPTEDDVRGAATAGHIHMKDANQVLAVEIPDSKITSDQAYSIYTQVQKKEGWKAQRFLEAKELTAMDGRKLWAVYPVKPPPSDAPQ